MREVVSILIRAVDDKACLLGSQGGPKKSGFGAMMGAAGGEMSFASLLLAGASGTKSVAGGSSPQTVSGPSSGAVSKSKNISSGSTRKRSIGATVTADRSSSSKRPDSKGATTAIAISESPRLGSKDKPFKAG